MKSWVALLIGYILGVVFAYAFITPTAKPSDINLKIAVDACIQQGGIPITHRNFYDEAESFERCQWKGGY